MLASVQEHTELVVDSFRNVQPMKRSAKHPVPDRVMTSFVIFDIRAL